MTDRRAVLGRLAPVIVVLLLAAAWLAPSPAGVGLTPSEAEDVNRWRATLDALPADGIVLVGFDPDIGTYAEIRATVRASLAELLAADLRLAFVNLTPEGRALLVAELARLSRLTANPTRILDLGFIPGAEAAVVALADGPPLPSGAEGALARSLADEATGALAALLVVGGNDIGPRIWVEQFLPRVDGLPVIAITPTVLLPEIQPYLATGQLDALLGTVRDGAAYRAAAELGPLERFREEAEPRGLPVLAGVVLATVVLAASGVGRLVAAARSLARDGRGA